MVNKREPIDDLIDALIWMGPAQGRETGDKTQAAKTKAAVKWGLFWSLPGGVCDVAPKPHS
jgi:hypothetical protein